MVGSYSVGNSPYSSSTALSFQVTIPHDLESFLVTLFKAFLLRLGGAVSASCVSTLRKILCVFLISFFVDVFDSF